MHELVLEARDQGTPSRAARVPLKVTVLDVNDNSPEIVDPQGDVVSVREEQPPGTEVARVRALDTDLGENASVTYTILKGNGVTIEPTKPTCRNVFHDPRKLKKKRNRKKAHIKTLEHERQLRFIRSRRIDS